MRYVSVCVCLWGLVSWCAVKQSENEFKLLLKPNCKTKANARMKVLRKRNWKRMMIALWRRRRRSFKLKQILFIVVAVYFKWFLFNSSFSFFFAKTKNSFFSFNFGRKLNCILCILCAQVSGYFHFVYFVWQKLSARQSNIFGESTRASGTGVQSENGKEWKKQQQQQQKTVVRFKLK